MFKKFKIKNESFCCDPSDIKMITQQEDNVFIQFKTQSSMFSMESPIIIKIKDCTVDEVWLVLNSPDPTDSPMKHPFFINPCAPIDSVGPSGPCSPFGCIDLSNNPSGGVTNG